MKYERHETDVEPEAMENARPWSHLLVHLLAKYDPVLREHLLRIQLGNKFATSYLSPTIQNEFKEFKVQGENLRSKVIKQMKETQYFSVIFDSTFEISHEDRTNQVLRYAMIDTDNVKIVESYADFIETKGKTSENISMTILVK